MNNTPLGSAILALLSLTVSSGVMAQSEAALEKEQPLAYALSKKINKEVELCIEGGSSHSVDYENKKHLYLMMPDAVKKCEKGVKSACDMTSSVLSAMVKVSKQTSHGPKKQER